MKLDNIWLDEAAVANDATLQSLCNQRTDSADYPLAAEIVSQIPVYLGASVRDAAAHSQTAPDKVRRFQEEWARCLNQGAGVVVVRNGIDDIALLDQVTEVFNTIIQTERESGSGADHFAPAGSNTRIWNAHEKLCIQAPELFAAYCANETMALMCHAWLGPGYQITAQANIVHPGGRAQDCHRDYHMGFQRVDELLHYPAHVHSMSPLLTLQGGIAHSDMPLESGPTKLLPFSQQFLPGYLATERQSCIDFFEAHCVQVALQKGDFLFFNPALMHAAGDNHTTDVQRFANLLQVGSVYGRAMEYLDRARMSVAVYPVLQRLHEQNANKGNTWSDRQTQLVIAACAEAYPFPANMELEPPTDGLAPLSQQQLMRQCLSEQCTTEQFAKRIAAMQALKRSH